jgi:hypothetical protein
MRISKLWLVGVAAASLIGLVPPAAPAAQHPFGEVKCGVVAVRATKYNVFARKLKCAYVRTWVARLVVKPGRKDSIGALRFTGPAGYYCGGTPFEDSYPFQLDGGCHKTKDITIAFRWMMVGF